MSTNLKISLAILFVAIVAFAGIYAKFNMGSDSAVEGGKKIYNPIVKENLSDLYDTNQLDKIIEKKKDDKDLESLIALASAYLQKGSLEFKEKDYGTKGLEIANKILAINKNSVTGYSLKGYAYEIMEEYPESLEAYNKSLEIEKTVSTLNQIGHVYDLMGNDKKSREYYSLAEKISPKDVNVKMNLARVDYEDGKFAESLKGFLYVYNNDSNARRKSEAAYMIGQIYLTEKLKDNKLAEKYLNSSKKIDSQFPLAWVGVGQIALVKGLEDASTDFSEQINISLNAFDKAIQLNPNQTEAYVKKAQVLFFMEQNDLAAKEYDNALKAVDKDITLMADNKVKMKKFIKEEMDIKKLKVSSLFKKVLIAMTFPGKTEAKCWAVYGGTNKNQFRANGTKIARSGFHCSSRKDFLDNIARTNKKYKKTDSHYWNITGSFATCNNGQTGHFDGCGNGIKESGETCDDGNVVNGDGCSSTCQIEKTPSKPLSVCGNGIKESGETCDDGNTYDRDGCSSTCQKETKPVCGNGIQESSWSKPVINTEECDLGNRNGGNSGCSSVCKVEPICGDNKKEGVETCDNGVLNGSLGNDCSKTCKIVTPCSNFCENNDSIEYSCDATDYQISKICKSKCTHNCGGGGGGKTDDDLTDPTDDDLTSPTEQEVCAANPNLCINTPQGNIDVDVYWSVDKIHWDDDFTKLIQLKNSEEKVYIKNTPQGVCDSNRSTIGLFNFGFSSTEGHVNNFMKKEKVEKFNNSAMFTTAPTNDAPVGTAFKQKLDVNYCTSATNKTKELNIKIVNMDRVEI